MPKTVFVLWVVTLFLSVFIFGQEKSIFISASAAELVDINTASLAQLDTLTGVGPVIAQRIIDNRPYSSLDDLLKVKGIGPKNLEKIKAQGLACVNCQDLKGQHPLTQDQTANNQPTTPPEKFAEGTPLQIATTTMEEMATPTAATAPAPITAVVYPKNVFINEVLPAPEGPDEDNEWIELYNANDFAVNLTGWKIKDTVGSTKSYAFPEKSIAPANGFSVVYRPESKIALQNSGDGLELFNPREELVDKMEFPKAPDNQSYNRTNKGWVWSKTLTPGLPNQIPSIEKSVGQDRSMANSPTTTSNNRLLANIALDTSNKKSSTAPHWPAIFSFVIGLIIAATCTAGALYFKKGQTLKAKTKLVQKNKKSTSF